MQVKHRGPVRLENKNELFQYHQMTSFRYTPWAIKRSQFIFVSNFVKTLPTSRNSCCYTALWKSKHQKWTWTQFQLL